MFLDKSSVKAHCCTSKRPKEERSIFVSMDWWIYYSRNTLFLVLTGENQLEITLHVYLLGYSKRLKAPSLIWQVLQQIVFVLKSFPCSMCNLIEQFFKVAVIVHFLMTYILVSLQLLKTNIFIDRSYMKSDENTFSI